MMEDAETPNTVPHLNIQQEITPLAARDYLQARDEAVVTPIPPFRARGNSAFLYYNPGKEGVCACSSAEHDHVHLVRKIDRHFYGPDWSGRSEKYTGPSSERTRLFLL